MLRARCSLRVRRVARPVVTLVLVTVWRVRLARGNLVNWARAFSPRPGVVGTRCWVSNSE